MRQCSLYFAGGCPLRSLRHMLFCLSSLNVFRSFALDYALTLKLAAAVGGRFPSPVDCHALGCKQITSSSLHVDALVQPPSSWVLFEYGRSCVYADHAQVANADVVDRGSNRSLSGV